MNRSAEAKQNRLMGIDAAAFAAWQAKQPGGAAVALSAKESEADASAADAKQSRAMGIDEAAFQAWLVKERGQGRGGVALMVGDSAAARGAGAGAACITIPFPR